MAFLSPDPVGIAGASGINGDQGIPALTPNLPSAMKALTRKWGGSNLGAAQQQYGSDLTNSLVKWELDRAQRGIAPVSPTATLNLLQSAKTNQAATPAPQRDPWDVLGNAAEDVGQIVTGLPKMPMQIGSDILHAGEIPAALASGDINKIANAPVIRDIPGVYTASNLAQGHFAEIASHPVQTALDVAPFAHAVNLGEHISNIPVPGSPEGLNVGDVIDRTKAALGRTMPGQLAKETFGGETRDVSRIMAEQPALIQQRALPALRDVFTSGLDRLRQDSTETQLAIDKIMPDRQRQGQFFAALEDPATVGATDSHGVLDALNATDAERAAVMQFKDARDAYSQYGIDAAGITQRVINGTPEIFTPQDAAKIDTARSKVARVETLANLRSAVLNPDTADLDALRSQVQEAIQNPTLKNKDIRNIASGYIHAMDVAGYDTGGLLRDINASGKARMIDLATNMDHSQLPQSTDILTRPARGTPALDSRTRWLERNSDMTQAALEKARAATGVKEAQVLPARFDPAFQRIKMDKAAAYVEQSFKADDPQFPQLLDAVHQHMYGGLGKDEVSAINAEALKAVNDLRDQGYNPEFIHHVSPDQERALASPSVTTIVPKASQYARRINDWTPTSDSLSVSLNHQGMELARQQGARAALDQIRDAHTVSVQDAQSDMRPIAERAAARRGTDYGTELERLMRKEYVPWSETENGFMAGGGKPFKFSDTSYKPDDLLISRTASRALEMMASPPTYSRIFNPVLKVFRSAILPFSPRFYLHHMGGGLMMNIMEDPRIAAEIPKGMAFAKDIHEMNQAMLHGEPGELSPTSQGILDRMPDSMKAQIGSLGYSAAPEDTFKFKGGGKLAELGQAAGVDRIMKAGGNAADWGFNVVNMVDTGYRAAAYLSGEKSALTAGLTDAESAARGMALVNKTMPRWLEMTPMERSVLRAVFPFYGFMSHIMRYAGNYAIDHPWRVSVMGGLSRAELQDLGTGLPQSLASAFLLGSPDAQGNVTGINGNLINPFRSVGDNLTVAGFMGNINPLFKTAMTQLGYDPISSGPNLYPQVQYDEVTGKLKAVNPSTPSLLGQVAGSIIPQVNILRALTGTSGDFRNLLTTNPDAASRLLGSEGGIPIAWKQYNVNDMNFSGELARETDAKKVLQTALKTGDYSMAMRYPSLHPYISQLQTLAGTGKLQAFQATSAAVPPTLAGNNAVQQGSQANTRAEVAAG